MKHLLLIALLGVLAITSSIAQAPQSFKFQAIARDVQGNVISNQQVSLRISLLQNNENGNVVYSEIHTVKTNQFGLINIEIGRGRYKAGEFSSINWGISKYFAQMEMDVNGGDNFVKMGVSQLLSVPYALYSESSGNSSKIATNTWETVGNRTYLKNLNSRLSIGTTMAPGKLTVNQDNNADALIVTGGGLGKNIASFIRDVGSNGRIDFNVCGADPQIKFDVEGGGTKWFIGVDDSPSDYFQIGYGGTSLSGSSRAITIDDGSGNVGIGTTNPSASAALEVSSTDKGLLPPRMTTTQMKNISNPATGLCIYNTVLEAPCYYNGTSWDCMDAQSLFNKTFFCGDNLRDLRDGKYYGTVQIGNQCWMAENLAYLPSVSPGVVGSVPITYPYYYVYGYQGTDVSAAKATTNYQTYGVLYNWPAAMNGASSSNNVPSGVQGVCPTGWHLPSDEEWKILEGEVDSKYNYPDPEWDKIGGRGIDAGGNLKETDTTHWNSPNLGATNISGFTALPGGMRYFYGYFMDMGDYARFWSSTEFGSLYGMNRYLKENSRWARRNTLNQVCGISVRCLKD